MVAVPGLGDGRYLGGNWAAIWNQSEHWLITVRPGLDNLFVRRSGNQYYSRAGRMDQRNSSSATGGFLGSVCFPSRFDGLRTGTTQA